jgi:homocysteine S-methyltransferase
MIMSKYRKQLPQLAGGLFLTDGGLETTLVFHERVDLPCFAAFHLLKDAAGRDMLVRYFERYIAIAEADRRGFILESPTWRSSRDWGEKLGYGSKHLAAANRESIGLMLDLRARHETRSLPMVVSGCVGPRGDGYDPGALMSADEAHDYHREQIATMVEAGADMVTAITMTNASEAIGVARAAAEAAAPVAISFTVETDGRLPTGQPLGEAIDEVDAATRSAPVYYMINCAHPLHFESTLNAQEPWMARIRGLRANASRRSHQELNDSPDLDDGNPIELGGQYRDLIRRHPQINVLGGCCGTDHRHVECISLACRLPSETISR